MIPEKTVQSVANRLYEVRTAARTMFGDRFDAKMAEYAEVIKEVQAARKIDSPLIAAKHICEVIHADGYQIIAIMASAVEILEPSA